jgi:copper resistance protein B
MKLKYTNYHLSLAGLFSLISIFVHAPQIQAGEWQPSETEISMEVIEEGREFTEKHQEYNSFPNLPVNASYDFCRNVTCNVSKTSYFNMTDKSQFTANTANLFPEELIQVNVEFANPEQWQLSQDNNTSEITNEEEWPEPIDDSQIYWFLLVDQLEYRGNDGEDSFYWDILSWVGGDYERLWIKSEGDVGLQRGNGEGEIQLLYGKLIAPFWDLQVGLRYDQLYGDSSRGRGFAVIGVQGLAPYLFEVDVALFISHQGDVSARVKAEYELLLSQRLVLQSKLETNIAAQRVEEFGVGSGINDLELGLRLRYEFNRQFAPYIGINWNRKFGDTAEIAREEGENDDQLSVVAGIRLLF